MEGLSNEHIAELLAPRTKSKSSTGRGHAFVRNPETGALDKVPLSEVQSVGRYEGKVGSMRRSRKGATRRLANGRRYYVPNWSEEVVSYCPK